MCHKTHNPSLHNVHVVASLELSPVMWSQPYTIPNRMLQSLWLSRFCLSEEEQNKNSINNHVPKAMSSAYQVYSNQRPTAMNKNMLVIAKQPLPATLFPWGTVTPTQLSLQISRLYGDKYNVIFTAHVDVYYKDCITLPFPILYVFPQLTSSSEGGKRETEHMFSYLLWVHLAMKIIHKTNPVSHHVYWWLEVLRLSMNATAKRAPR